MRWRQQQEKVRLKVERHRRSDDQRHAEHHQLLVFAERADILFKYVVNRVHLHCMNLVQMLELSEQSSLKLAIIER